MLTVSTLNVQATALPRARLLLPWLLDKDHDVWVITETTRGAGTTYLLDGLTDAGYHTLHPGAETRDRGAALASRVPFTNRPSVTNTLSLPHRAVCVDLTLDPTITILGIYVPSSDRAPDKVAKKRAFVTSLLAAVRVLGPEDRSRLVLCGDYNVISRDHQPAYRGFLPFEYDMLDALDGCGLVDAYQHLSPGVQAHSWVGRNGNGYRFDYIHIGEALSDHVSACRYDQQPREQGLTDHAAVTMALNESMRTTKRRKIPVRRAAPDVTPV